MRKQQNFDGFYLHVIVIFNYVLNIMTQTQGPLHDSFFDPHKHSKVDGKGQRDFGSYLCGSKAHTVKP